MLDVVRRLRRHDARRHPSPKANFFPRVDQASHLDRALRRQDPRVADGTVAEVRGGEQGRVTDRTDEASVRRAVEIEGGEQPPPAHGGTDRPPGDEQPQRQQARGVARVSALARVPGPRGLEIEAGGGRADRSQHAVDHVARIRQTGDLGDQLAEDEVADVGVRRTGARLEPRPAVAREQAGHQLPRVRPRLAGGVNPSQRKRVRETRGVAEELAHRDPRVERLELREVRARRVVEPDGTGVDQLHHGGSSGDLGHREPHERGPLVGRPLDARAGRVRIRRSRQALRVAASATATAGDATASRRSAKRSIVTACAAPSMAASG